VERVVFETLDLSEGGAIAEVVEPESIEAGIETVRASLGALRLFQASRRQWTETTFGLPAELSYAVTRLVTVWERSGVWLNRSGHVPGYRFSEEALSEWHRSDAFTFLDSALSAPADEGRQRAVRGLLVFDRAVLEHLPDLRMLGFAGALEAWLLRRSAGSQTLRLARHVAWFGCGAHSGILCGRERPICPYLYLRPERGDEQRLLGRLKKLGDAHVAWRCSEWRRVMNWYDARSEVAHGGMNAVDAKAADDAEFWIARFLVQPILLWMRDHPVDPIGALEAALNSQDEPAGWRAMVEAIDSDPPPPVPPSRL
jgi:hypothetical protein